MFSNTSIVKTNLTLMLPMILLFATTTALSNQASYADGATPSLYHLSTHHVPGGVNRATLKGHVEKDRPVNLTLVLPLRNQDELNKFIVHVYDPKDPLYRQYLSSQEFDDEYGPTAADQAAVVNFAKKHGFKIESAEPGSTDVRVSGTEANVEDAFNITLNDYKDAGGRTFFAPSGEPTVTLDVSNLIHGIIGIDNAAVITPAIHSAALPEASGLSSYLLPLSSTNGASLPSIIRPLLTSSGIDGLLPGDIRSIYNLPSPSTGYNGVGQTAALVELDTYYSSDIQLYESENNITSPPSITPISVDGFSTATPPLTSRGYGEPTLDIDMLLAIAPNLSQINVYESANNTNQNVYDIYSKIASDDTASVVSTSWGGPAYGVGVPGNTFTQSEESNENQVFQKMAAQGQSFFCASGDCGAYADEASYPGILSVQDPASQPYVTSVGGTDLVDTNSLPTYYVSEAAWADTGDYGRGANGTGGGGGFDPNWAIPSYQWVACSTAANPQGSSLYRNVPDVSLFGDYDDGGYQIYFNGSTKDFNGTSAAAPLWAGFTALVNQQRQNNNLPNVGFLNSIIYPIGESSAYSNDFHDVTTGNNLYYNAVTGYDNATGWGSFNGINLLNDLAGKGSTFVLYNDQPGTAELARIQPDGFKTTYPFNFGAGSQVVGLASGPHGNADVLVSNTNGSVTVDQIDPENVIYSSTTLTPNAGWTAKSIAVGADGLARILWTSSSTISIVIWTVQANGTTVSQVLTPASGWVAEQIVVGTDNLLRVLWQSSTTNQIVVWTVQSDGSNSGPVLYPNPGWNAQQMTIGSDNLVRILFTSASNNSAVIWTVASNGTETGAVYGPYSGYSQGTYLTAKGLTTNIDGTTEIYWDQAISAGGSSNALDELIEYIGSNGVSTNSGPFVVSYPNTQFLGISGVTYGTAI